MTAASTPQPPPTARQESRKVLDAVLVEVDRWVGGAPVAEALIARDEMGSAKYGTSLMTHNGRAALVDAWQEALDLVMYLGQAVQEGRGDVYPLFQSAIGMARDLASACGPVR